MTLKTNNGDRSEAILERKRRRSHPRIQLKAPRAKRSRPVERAARAKPARDPQAHFAVVVLVRRRDELTVNSSSKNLS